ncbi:MAG TPA: hypothetical protein VM370_02105 [Candidatus Thermoplasmatota archaeon]|nr:hypothetical protein [Candidatus Thermoplasmatota archaeon]
MRSILVPMFALLLLTAPFALADECVPTTSFAPIAAAGYYVYEPCIDPDDASDCSDWGPWSIWVYEESNGIAGLQREDELRDDTCGGMIDSDTFIF